MRWELSIVNAGDDKIVDKQGMIVDFVCAGFQKLFVLSSAILNHVTRAQAFRRRK